MNNFSFHQNGFIRSNELRSPLSQIRMSATTLSNQSILENYKSFKIETHARHIQYLRARNPKYADWTDEEIEHAFADVVSCFQS